MHILTDLGQKIDHIFDLENLLAVNFLGIRTLIVIVDRLEIIFIEDISIGIPNIKDRSVVWPILHLFIVMSTWPIIVIEGVHEDFAFE